MRLKYKLTERKREMISKPAHALSYRIREEEKNKTFTF
jgi:hypothetical protein